MKKSLSFLILAMVLALILSSCGKKEMMMPMTMMDGASNALVTLATTGNPKPLQAELGGEIVESTMLMAEAGDLLNLEKDEHLAPKALITPDGEVYAMVAPTITKDNFIFKDTEGNLMRMDVGSNEGHFMPFVVNEIMEDGGTPWYKEFWYWLTGK